MSELANILGPLVAPECRHSLGRGWLFWARIISACVAAAVVLCVGWYWWFSVEVDANFRPHDLLRGTLIALEGIALTTALVMSPAVLGGSLAAEKSRGTLGMLLIARVNAAEIVVARLMSRLGQVLVLLAAMVPLVLLVTAFLWLPIDQLLPIVLLPAAVAFGAGGIAIAASAIARRARDALLAVYLSGLILISAPSLAASFFFTLPLDAFGGLNPFSGLIPLVWFGDTTPAWRSIAWWAGMGLAGTGWAAWRIRPAYLRQISEGSKRSGRRSARIPAVTDSPMLWKELHIERMRAFGRVARFVGWLAALLVGGATLWLVGDIEWHRWISPDRTAADWGVTVLRKLMAGLAWPLSWLIQWAVGLRAAVTVAQEREQATWDALLASPLEGREIILPKMGGSLYALRWLLIVVLAAWTIALAYGAMRPETYAYYVSQTLVVSAFMAVVGVWSSLVSSTTTRAMTITLGIWLAAAACSAAIAGLLTMTTLLAAFYAWLVAVNLGLTEADLQTLNVVPTLIGVGFVAFRLASYAFTALLVAITLRFRFDGLAGRGG